LPPTHTAFTAFAFDKNSLALWRIRPEMSASAEVVPDDEICMAADFFIEGCAALKGLKEPLKNAASAAGENRR